jgi:hypothetical protein
MNILTSTPSPARPLNRAKSAALSQPPQTNLPAVSVAPESFESSSVVSSAIKSALVGAAYGALVGGSTHALYSNTDLMTATAVHAGGILVGGGLGAVAIGTALKKKAEPPAAYALGALAGAGVTWATSAFGMLPHPTVGLIAGATLGAFFGAVGGAIHASKGTNDRPTVFGASETLSAAPQAGPQVPKAAWSGISIAYGVGGTAITAAMVAKGLAGTLTPSMAAAGGLVALGAFANAYLTHKTAQMKS